MSDEIKEVDISAGSITTSNNIGVVANTNGTITADNTYGGVYNQPYTTTDDYTVYNDAIQIGSVAFLKKEYFDRLNDLVVSLNKSGHAPEESMRIAKNQLNDMILDVYGNKEDKLAEIERL